MKGLVPAVRNKYSALKKKYFQERGKRVHSIAANTVEGAIPSVQIKKQRLAGC